MSVGNQWYGEEGGREIHLRLEHLGGVDSYRFVVSHPKDQSSCVFDSMEWSNSRRQMELLDHGGKVN